MSLRDVPLDNVYKTFRNDIVNDFYIPTLSVASKYKRAVGFFSSAALIDLTKGLSALVKNGGRMEFVVSPYLSQDDIDAINEGYEKREIIERALLRQYKEPETYFEKERHKLLSYLIAEKYLEIKVAFTPKDKEFGQFHEKVGIIEDKEGDFIVFTGSLNETINAFHNNFESIVVLKSWEPPVGAAEKLKEDFDKLWQKEEQDLEVLDFPDVLKERFKVRDNSKPNFNIDEEQYGSSTGAELPLKKRVPKLPEGFQLRDYQIEAINNWQEEGYRGIFDMATGTGKTYTGLGAAAKLFEVEKRLALIIVCPYQHLVEQWVEDIEFFNMRPIIGYSASKQKNWKKRLKDAVLDYSEGFSDHFCFVTTNATYATKYVSDLVKMLGENTLLIVDEAHNFGSPRLQETLYPQIEWRLALSATLERHGDPEGTNCLYSYFGTKCIEYDLKRAIKAHQLTPYKYYPIVVYLEPDEIDNYRDLSYLISKECYYNKKKQLVVTELGKSLMIKRARIIAGAKNKLPKLKELMEEYRDKSHILVYCGATKINDFENDVSDEDTEGERQIVAVSKMLGNELGMKVTHFTSKEKASEREYIKKSFAAADPYQALIAIKCLDEGVNIPAINTAFILASTTNPKEYIQRRGRVLRLAKGKTFATIYDFVTFIRPLIEANEYSEDYQMERSLAKKELSRIQEFGSIAINSFDSELLIEDVKDTYQISDEEMEESGYEYDLQ